MIHFRTYTLDNGLRIVHSEDRTTQMVALNVLYDVGARDEDPMHTGFAHLFEHLMFGGSKHIPRYDEPLQRAGGESNAWTNNDITNYYLTIPRQNVEIAFWLESDRMLQLDFSTQALEVQRQVVMEEFKQRNLNQPYGDLGHLLRPLTYKVHPYRWPTIGMELSHIANASLWEVQNFYERFYTPGNAVLAVTGNISFETTVRLAEKWFAPIPSRETQLRKLPQEPPQTAERRLEVERPVPIDALYMAFHTCGRFHPDFHAFDIVSDVLCNGRSSRLIRRLVNDRKIFSSIDAYVTASLDPGLFQIAGKPAEGVSLQEAEDAIWEELRCLKEELVDQEELEKVKNQFEANELFSNMHYLQRAYNLAFYELAGGDALLINKDVSQYRSIDDVQLQSIVRRAFDRSNCSVIHYHAS